MDLNADPPPCGHHAGATIWKGGEDLEMLFFGGESFPPKVLDLVWKVHENKSHKPCFSK
jgi:hypothetical protein